jgi:hypothetical protein
LLERSHRLDAPDGRLELNYQMVISVEPEMLDANALNVAPLHELPLEALVFLYPQPVLPIRPFGPFRQSRVH